jgi:ATPase family AAA domain-containing protein 2
MVIDENGAGPSGHAHAGNGDGDPVSGGSVPPIIAARELPRKPHDIDLEKMHSKLYYDRYLTPEQFLEDLVKIVENAELDLYDSERLWKAKQMLNQASLLVDGCCDAGFRLECRRMAQREADRETKRAAEKAKEEGQSGTVGAGTDSPRAARASTRGTGTALEFTLSDPVAIERKAKRARAESAGASTSPGLIDGDIGEPPLQKRTRTDAAESEDVQMAEVSSPSQRLHGKEFSASNGPNTISATSVTNSVVLEGAPPPAPASPFAPSSSLPAEGVSIANGANAEASALNDAATGPLSESLPSADAPAAASSGEHPEHAPAVELASSPRLPPPSFILPPAALAELSDLLTTRTARLNIEQLEQLRASLLNCVWHRRAEWDRTDLLVEMKASLENFVAEVEEELDDEWA